LAVLLTGLDRAELFDQGHHEVPLTPTSVEQLLQVCDAGHGVSAVWVAFGPGNASLHP